MENLWNKLNTEEDIEEKYTSIKRLDVRYTEADGSAVVPRFAGYSPQLNRTQSSSFEEPYILVETNFS